MSASEQNDAGQPQLDCLVYVAEDDPSLRQLAGLLLEMEHIPHQAFCNGEEALKAFDTAARKPNLVVSDFSMGMYNMNGVQFLAAIKQRNPAIRCLLVSGTVERASVVVDGKPVDKYMSKPYDTNDFLNTVKTLLGLPVTPAAPPPPSPAPDAPLPPDSLQ